MKPSGAHTHPGGSGSAALALAAVIIAAAVAVPVVDALARLAEVFVITLGAVLGLAVLAGAVVAVRRVRQGPAIGAASATSPRPVPWQATDTLSAPRRPAIERPTEVHLHFHGVSAEDMSAIVARVKRQGR